MATKKKLNAQQQLFVQEYLKDLNATQAAIRAGYSAKTAASIGHRLLTWPQIQEAVNGAMQERSARVKLDTDDVLRELAAIATSDVRHLTVGEDGRLRLAMGAPEHAFRAVQSVKHRRREVSRGPHRAPAIEHITEVRYWDKNVALANIGRHLKLFPSVHEVSGPNGGPIETKRSGLEDLSNDELAQLAQDLARASAAAE